MEHSPLPLTTSTNQRGFIPPASSSLPTSSLSPPTSSDMDFYDTDIVIIVTGQCGSGRSTFINALLPESVPGMRVGASLNVCTTQIACAPVDLKDVVQCPSGTGKNRLVLVDTPGFENDELKDRAVLHKIKLWLRKTYPSGKPRGGVIYMRDSKSPTSDAAFRLEVEAVNSLKWIFRDNMCFVVTQGEDLPEQERIQIRVGLAERWARVLPPESGIQWHDVEAREHIWMCGQTRPCRHNVWQPINVLLTGAERQISPGDIVLLVTGPIGSGKSTFINALTAESGKGRMKVGAKGSACAFTHAPEGVEFISALRTSDASQSPLLAHQQLVNDITNPTKKDHELGNQSGAAPAPQTNRNLSTSSLELRVRARARVNEHEGTSAHLTKIHDFDKSMLLAPRLGAKVIMDSSGWPGNPTPALHQYSDLSISLAFPPPPLLPVRERLPPLPRSMSALQRQVRCIQLTLSTATFYPGVDALYSPALSRDPGSCDSLTGIASCHICPALPALPRRKASGNFKNLGLHVVSETPLRLPILNLALPSLQPLHVVP
ncbi:hypothetical protein NMY22_g19179 [Coprinellus aureogranulatus]|nr:hypothetical protein NMY22_g19179 [Coprinellus aureogranulatus]